MKPEALMRRSRQLAKRHRVTNGARFRLRDVDPNDAGPFDASDKERAGDDLAAGIVALAELQDKLYAQDRWAVLLVFQAMDAAGKDGVIKHVMSGINPQGCEVTSFKAPSEEELDHDYLWRCQKRLPERGRIGIFNRSYYEEVLVVRVHPEILARQKLPAGLVTPGIWKQRFGEIRDFERHLTANGVAVRKFFLHVSPDEQKKRFLERIDDPAKNWKFSSSDLGERARWKEYMRAYEEMIRETATPEAPWFVVPADRKWYTRLVVAAAVIDTLAALDLAYPELEAGKRQELEKAKRALLDGS